MPGSILAMPSAIGVPRVASIRRHRRVPMLAAALAAAALLAPGAATTAGAQTAPGILAPGNAVVTGFSGTRTPAAVPPGATPADLTEIDLSGPSARVVDLQAPGAPPQAQVLNAPKPFTATASQIGQVFGVALDDATPPNVFVAATSAYGLPIIAPGPNGGPIRVTQGAPNATFMPGLFGPPQAGAGPGSIWRIDGATGAVRLFANVTLDGAANAGAALGGLAFDPVSHMLFVADRGTGMIHAFDPSGTERGRFDHGTQGRAAAGLPPVPFDPAGRLDITNPAFKTDDPATWGFAAVERRIFGLGVHASRLYYAVADEQVWSVSIAQDGAFGADARIELQLAPWDGESEISKIAFDDRGGMLLAERPGPTGAYDFNALAKEGVGRVLHYQQVPPQQVQSSAPADQQTQPAPASESVPQGGSPLWQPVPDEYAIGFPDDMRNGNGGVAIGYSYTPSGAIDRGACGGFLWTTGEQLRVTADQALAAQLAAGGPAIVNGLQGNAIEAVRPANVPPLATYFVDYDDQFADPAARGHLGDVAIWRVCGQAFVPAFPRPSLAVPAGFCQPDEIRLPGGECCDRRFVRRGRCEPHVCPPDTIRLPDGQCCDPRQVRRGRCGCPPDTIRLPNGECCDPRQVRDGRCGCPPDTIRQPNGQCCDPRLIRDGRCGPPPQTCPRGEVQLPNGQCCDPRQVRDGRCLPPPQTCPPGKVLQPNGQCCNPRLLTGKCQPPLTIQTVPERHHRIVHIVRVPVHERPHRVPRHVAPHWQQGGGNIRLPHGQPHVFRPVGGQGKMLR